MLMMHALWGPPNPADADDARPVRASAPSSKSRKTSPRAAGPVAAAPSAHDARRLACWSPPRGPETRHTEGNGCETRACSERSPGEVPWVCIMGPSFLHRAARDLVGRYFSCFGAPAGEHAAGIMSTRRARSGPSGAGRCFRRSGGVPEGLKLVPARAMMLMMLTGRPQRWLPRACNDAGQGGGRGTKRDGARACARVLVMML